MVPDNLKHCLSCVIQTTKISGFHIKVKVDWFGLGYAYIYDFETVNYMLTEANYRCKHHQAVDM